MTAHTKVGLGWEGDRWFLKVQAHVLHIPIEYGIFRDHLPPAHPPHPPHRFVVRKQDIGLPRRLSGFGAGVCSVLCSWEARGGGNTRRDL